MNKIQIWVIPLNGKPNSDWKAT